MLSERPQATHVMNALIQAHSSRRPSNAPDFEIITASGSALLATHHVVLARVTVS